MAPAAAAWRRLESGKETSTRVALKLLKSRWNFRSSAVEADGEGYGSRGGGVEADRIRRIIVLARCASLTKVAMDLQQWKLTVRAVAPVAVAWRQLKSGEEMYSGSLVAVKSRWNFSLGS